MTAASSRIAQTPVLTTPSPRRHWRTLPSTTTQPLTSSQPPTTPSVPLKRPTACDPDRLGPLTTPRTPYWTQSQRPTGSPYRSQRPTINPTLPKKQGETWLGEKLDNNEDGNQVYKRPRGRGRNHGYKRRYRVGSVRLVSTDGLPDRGRVEIFIRGEWGTVCDDLFTSKAGTVVCRQLGFTTAVAVMKRAALGEADSNVRIFLDDVECEGGERSLLWCKRARIGKHNCSHGEDVGVICG